MNNILSMKISQDIIITFLVMILNLSGQIGLYSLLYRALPKTFLEKKT